MNQTRTFSGKVCVFCVSQSECTMDRHFVFLIHSSAADPPLSPASLVTAGDNPCTPQKVTDDWALFKIPLDECGAHRYVSRFIAIGVYLRACVRASLTERSPGGG